MPKSNGGTRARGKNKDREVPVGGFYAASSVIKRGTANKLLADRKGNECACGCENETQGGLFLPGHDSKARAQGKAVKEGRMKASDLAPVTKQYLEQGGML